jgi:2,4-dienoyl-CoA reductase-like NADH-dependent reductase (Old Yellow Enzyme family)
LKHDKGDIKMSKLFERSEINGMELSNRFVRSATWEGMAAEDGAYTPKLMKIVTDLAEGGVGLIISSHAYIMENGQAGPWQIGVYKDEFIEGFREMTRAVKEHGSRIVLQISHAGFFANPKLIGQTPLPFQRLKGFQNPPQRP